LIKSRTADGIPVSPSSALVTNSTTCSYAFFSASISSADFCSSEISFSIIGSIVSFNLRNNCYANSSELLLANFLGLIIFFLDLVLFFFLRDLVLELLDLGES